VKKAQDGKITSVSVCEPTKEGDAKSFYDKCGIDATTHLEIAQKWINLKNLNGGKKKICSISQS